MVSIRNSLQILIKADRHIESKSISLNHCQTQSIIFYSSSAMYHYWEKLSKGSLSIVFLTCQPTSICKIYMFLIKNKKINIKICLMFAYDTLLQGLQ